MQCTVGGLIAHRILFQATRTRKFCVKTNTGGANKRKNSYINLATYLRITNAIYYSLKNVSFSDS